MNDDMFNRVTANPHYKELKAKRSRFAWTLTLIMLAVYYGYILLIAFKKELLATPIGDGVMTVGIPVGLGVIVFTILITGFYVRRANSEFDELTRKIVEESRQ
jgi:uncharacterized membrane protein (DUF485 family)